MNLIDNQLLKILKLDNYSGFYDRENSTISIAYQDREIGSLLVRKIGGAIYRGPNYLEWRLTGKAARELIKKF